MSDDKGLHDLNVPRLDRNRGQREGDCNECGADVCDCPERYKTPVVFRGQREGGEVWPDGSCHGKPQREGGEPSKMRKRIEAADRDFREFCDHRGQREGGEVEAVCGCEKGSRSPWNHMPGCEYHQREVDEVERVSDKDDYRCEAEIKVNDRNRGQRDDICPHCKQSNLREPTPKSSHNAVTSGSEVGEVERGRIEWAKEYNHRTGRNVHVGSLVSAQAAAEERGYQRGERETEKAYEGAIHEGYERGKREGREGAARKLTLDECFEISKRVEWLNCAKFDTIRAILREADAIRSGEST